MEENITNTIVENAEEKLFEAAENLDKAIADAAVQTATAVPAPVAQPKNPGMALTLGLTVGGFTIGLGAGYALDRWGIPALNRAVNNAKAKRAAKKAEKLAKKAAKKAASIPAPVENKPAEAPAMNDVPDNIMETPPMPD